MVMSEQKPGLGRSRWRPSKRCIGGVDHKVMAMGPGPASRKALKKKAWTADQAI